MMWLAIISVGLGSYAMRVVPLFTVGRLDLAPRVERALARAGTAALTALTVGAVLDVGTGDAVIPTLAAVVAGGSIAVRGGSLLRVVTCGVIVNLVITGLVGALG